jgi:hypothetical protein
MLAYKKQVREEFEEKQCKNCNTDFFEKDNYNWSCKIHTSTYNGSMWWCCGKEAENARGCHVSKHEAREDEEDEAAGERHEEKVAAGIFCYSCKHVGHAPEVCSRDPNIRT